MWVPLLGRSEDLPFQSGRVQPTLEALPLLKSARRRQQPAVTQVEGKVWRGTGERATPRLPLKEGVCISYHHPLPGLPLEARKAAAADLIALPWAPGGDPTRCQRWEGRQWLL